MAAPVRDITVEPKNGIRTCVPQHIELGEDGETVRLFMRVRQPMRKIRLEIRNQGQVIMTKPLPVAKPSEMIAVDLPAEKAKGLEGTLEVAIQEGV